MQGARASDSGIYKCQPNNAPEAQIKVHILIGGKLFKAAEKPISLLVILFLWNQGLFVSKASSSVCSNITYLVQGCYVFIND